MKIKSRLLLFTTLWLCGCNTYVHEPWVPNSSYLKQERSRSPELNQLLEHRVRHEMDR